MASLMVAKSHVKIYSMVDSATYKRVATTKITAPFGRANVRRVCLSWGSPASLANMLKGAADLRRLQADVTSDAGSTVVRKGRIRSHGSCSCGWEGKPHLLVAVAVHDAHMHAVTSRCHPAAPLVR